MRNSKYWDDFNIRAEETITCLKEGLSIPVRRVAIFITNMCNLRCKYCNHVVKGQTLPEERFLEILEKYGETALFHITGGEPSVVPYLYPLIRKYSDKYRFHLNTNAIIEPPAESIHRLKVSLDSCNSAEWDLLVGKQGAFQRVVSNLKKCMSKTVTSVTFTLTKSNYKNAVDFVRFANRELSELYAMFFSVYKGDNPEFVIDQEVGDDFFENVLPILRQELPEESLALIDETIDEKRRLIQGKRFEQSLEQPCYLSMSERVVNPLGNEYTCSHLFRDGIFMTEPVKHEKCRYGCNQRLVMFNEYVQCRL